jgi:hypothetical protein
MIYSHKIKIIRKVEKVMNAEVSRNVENVILHRWEESVPVVPPASNSFISYCYDPDTFANADPFVHSVVSKMSVREYIDRVLKYMTGSDVNCVAMAIRLIDKYHLATGCTIRSHNAALIFFVALMVATKTMSDELHHCEYYSRVAGVAREVLVSLEVIFVFECRWDLLPSDEEHATYLALISSAPKDEANGCPNVSVAGVSLDVSTQSI